MYDEAPAVEQDQPTDATTEAPDAVETDQPTGGEGESFTDSFNPEELPEEARTAYEAAYKRLQGDYTRKTQEISQTRQEAERYAQIVGALQNPDTRAAVLQQFGIDLVEDEEDLADEEEPDLYSKVERLEQSLTQREQAEQAAQQEEAVADFVAGEIEALEKRESREFDANEHRLIDTYARTYPQSNGAPDVQGAYELLTGIVSSRQKAWVESKKAPRKPGTGVAGSKAADLTNKDEREAAMAAAAAEVIASRESQE